MKTRKSRLHHSFLKVVLCLAIGAGTASPVPGDDSVSGKELAKRFNLSAGSKAILQWERIFRSERKLKRYGLDKLDAREREILKRYLIDHAIDSDHPTIAGEY